MQCTCISLSVKKGDTLGLAPLSSAQFFSPLGRVSGDWSEGCWVAESPGYLIIWPCPGKKGGRRPKVKLGGNQPPPLKENTWVSFGLNGAVPSSWLPLPRPSTRARGPQPLEVEGDEKQQEAQARQTPTPGNSTAKYLTWRSPWTSHGWTVLNSQRLDTDGPGRVNSWLGKT